MWEFVIFSNIQEHLMKPHFRDHFYDQKIKKSTHSPAKEDFGPLPASMKEHQSLCQTCLSPHPQDTWPGRRGKAKVRL